MNIRNRFFLYFFSLIGLSLVMGMLLANQADYLWLIGLLALGFIGLFALIRQDFLAPIVKLQYWARQYQQEQHQNGALKHSSFKEIPEAIAHLVAENEELYEEMDDVLQAQIKRLSKKSSLLETLYSVSSSLNEIKDADSLLAYFLQVFINMTQANSGVIRMLDNSDSLLNLASIKGNLDNKGQVISLSCQDCVCGKIAQETQNNVQFSVHTCAKCVGETSQKNCQYGTIFIPLVHQNKTLGIVNLFFDSTPSLSQDERSLLKTIGDHLAIAVDKSKTDATARRLSLSQERLYLSQDIHDSLSQILYSMGLQTSALLDIIQKSSKQEAFDKASNIKDGISQANQELRQLLNNFRKPLSEDNNDLLSRIKELASQIESQTNLSIYVHCVETIEALPEIENQILSIVQEVLNNVKKHADANNVRVLLSKESMLIEDDGCGFCVDNKDNQPLDGFHLGLKILDERAQRIGATIKIESEIGEGTQVILNLNKPTPE